MDYEFLSNTRLFRGTSPQEARQMLSCLAAVTRAYQKGETICRAGEQICAAGLVLRGSVTVESDDFWGNRSILSRAAPGDIFGEAYACLPEQPLLVSVVAAANCEVLFLDMARVMRVCSNACAHHGRIVQNLLALCAEKNLQLSQRMLHTAPKTIRARLLSCFHEMSQRAGSRHFSLPYNRQALADYLNVDRSAMCAELSKMKADGLIDYTKNTVTLLLRTL
ncbi:MAG: Crp/Fnr family transcriptional regulator [Oscillospiraceae bacterium]